MPHRQAQGKLSRQMPSATCGVASDPFDPILIAQAMSEPLHLVTTDERLKPYSELVVWVLGRDNYSW
ncbi:MAG: hypothetical protein ACLPXT_06555 [Terracidiphilus sp.]